MNELMKKIKLKIILVRSSPLNIDIRTPKLIKALNEKGYSTTLVNWEREGKNPSNKLKEISCTQIPLRVRAPFGFRVIPFYILWWFYVFTKLSGIKLDLIYAINFDCAIPAIIISKLKRKPIVYEVLDVYEDQAQFPRWIRQILLGIDKLIFRFSDAVVLVDEMQLLELEGIPNNNIYIIYDSPPKANIEKELEIIEDSKNNDFTLFYAGVLMKSKLLNIDKVVEAIKDIDGVKLIIAGYGDLVPEIKRLESSMPSKIHFVGKISYEEVIKKGAEANAFFILRDTSRKSNVYTCGSNLFNAMACGKPIIVNKGTSTAIKVKKERCGIIVNARDVSEIKTAILRLKNDKRFWKELATNARKAYDQKYSWEIMERRLYDLFKALLF
jgi:glycosyltransferase involved in cell wall biosynthesis